MAGAGDLALTQIVESLLYGTKVALLFGLDLGFDFVGEAEWVVVGARARAGDVGCAMAESFACY